MRPTTSSDRRFRRGAAIPCLVLGLLLLSCEDPAGLPRVPAELRVLAGDAQEGVVGQPLDDDIAVLVLDAAGRPVAGTAVTFVVVSGGGTLFSGATLSDRNGIARDGWTLGPSASEEQVVEARVLPADGDPLTARFTATAEAAAAAAAAGTSPTDQEGTVGEPVPSPPTIRVLDGFGNPVEGAEVTWSVVSGGGSLSETATVTGPDGISSVGWVLGPVLSPPQVVSATAAGLGAVEFIARAGLPPGYVFEKLAGDGQSDTVAAVLLTPLSVRLATGDGSPLIGGRIRWVTAAGAVVSYADTDSDGKAQLTWQLGTGAGVQVAYAVLEAGPDTVGFEATAEPATPVRLEITPSSLTLFPLGAGSDMDALAFDRFDNPVPDLPVAWSSGDTTVAVVDTVGGVTAVRHGTTAVHAATGALTAEARAVFVPGELVFWGQREYLRGDLWVMTAEGEAETFLGSGSNPVYSRGGRELAYEENTMSYRYLYLANADRTDPQLLMWGERYILSGPVSWSPGDESMAITWRQTFTDSADVALVDRTGGLTVLTEAFSREICFPDWAPDGGSLAVSVGCHGETALAVLAPDGSTLDTIPGDDPDLAEVFPSWSPSGDRLAFLAVTADEPIIGSVYVMNADGSSRTAIIGHSRGKPAWSPDGSRLALALYEHPAHGTGIFVVSADGADVTQLTDFPDSGVDWLHPPR